MPNAVPIYPTEEKPNNVINATLVPKIEQDSSITCDPYLYGEPQPDEMCALQLVSRGTQTKTCSSTKDRLMKILEDEDKVIEKKNTELEKKSLELRNLREERINTYRLHKSEKDELMAKLQEFHVNYSELKSEYEKLELENQNLKNAIFNCTAENKDKDMKITQLQDYIMTWNQQIRNIIDLQLQSVDDDNTTFFNDQILKAIPIPNIELQNPQADKQHGEQFHEQDNDKKTHDLLTARNRYASRRRCVGRAAYASTSNINKQLLETSCKRTIRKRSNRLLKSEVNDSCSVARNIRSASVASVPASTRRTYKRRAIVKSNSDVVLFHNREVSRTDLDLLWKHSNPNTGPGRWFSKVLELVFGLEYCMTHKLTQGANAMDPDTLVAIKNYAAEKLGPKWNWKKISKNVADIRLKIWPLLWQRYNRDPLMYWKKMFGSDLHKSVEVQKLRIKFVKGR